MSILVADIGGTNARFACIDGKNIRDIETLRCSNYRNVDQAIDFYREKYNLYEVKHACFAVAAKVSHNLGKINMTNNHWFFEPKTLETDCKIGKVSLINDFSAVGYSIPKLQKSDFVVINQGEDRNDRLQKFGVVGAGTGLGVCCAVKVAYNNSYHTISSEGGHLNFAAESDEEIQLLKYLLKVFNRVSYERVISGEGIVNLYNAVCKIENVEPQNINASDIGRMGINNHDELCNKVMYLFFKLLGRFAGDIALAYNVSEMYIAGGIVPRYLEFMQTTDFFKQFCNKGRFSEYNKNTSIKVIINDYPGLLGAGNYIELYK